MWVIYIYISEGYFELSLIIAEVGNISFIMEKMGNISFIMAEVGNLHAKLEGYFMYVL